MSIETLDPRLFAFRNDLADERLRGRVAAAQFADGEAKAVAVPVADMRTRPSSEAGLGTQVLLGDRVRVFETDQGWAWCQAERDGYVGYVPETTLVASQNLAPATHRVAVPRTFAYTGPDLKRPVAASLSLGASVIVEGGETNGTLDYARLADGTWCVAKHLHPIGETRDDFVAVAESLIATPYLWGGTSAFGIDCSGIVQLAMMMAGIRAPRDSDMQEAGLGRPLAPDASLRRGDLVFWKGHVGIMRDSETMLHANAHTMDVTSEPLARAAERIARLYGQPTSRRRPDELARQ